MTFSSQHFSFVTPALAGISQKKKRGGQGKFTFGKDIFLIQILTY
jgi:hypothetical protein